MMITDKEQKHVARIIEREIGWMIGWSPTEEGRRESIDAAAKKVTRYLSRKIAPPLNVGKQ